MNTGLPKSLSSQKGASIFATIIVVVLIGMFLMAGLKIAPAYMDNNVINNAINSMDERGELSSMSAREIRTSLLRTLNTNGIREFDGDNVVLNSDNGKRTLNINYETRIPLFYNIDAIVKFKNQFDAS